MPRAVRFSMVAGPNKSSPTRATIDTRAPHRPRGHGLVGAFPSEAEMEFSPENRLAGTRKQIG